jgi:hypothetical protein
MLQQTRRSVRDEMVMITPAQAVPVIFVAAHFAIHRTDALTTFAFGDNIGSCGSTAVGCLALNAVSAVVLAAFAVRFAATWSHRAPLDHGVAVLLTLTGAVLALLIGLSKTTHAAQVYVAIMYTASFAAIRVLFEVGVIGTAVDTVQVAPGDSSCA